MTGNQTSHISVTYQDGFSQITCIYAISEDVARKLSRKRLWPGRHMKHPTGKDLRDWLEKKGCKLDSSDGPALVGRKADGSTLEKYYRKGELHREGGPAFVRHDANGATEEIYYRDGKPHREAGPAHVKRYADGETEEYYYRNGKLHRENGPAEIRRYATGSTYEAYYLDGKFVKEEKISPPSTPDVTLRPSAPKAPGAFVGSAPRATGPGAHP